MKKITDILKRIGVIGDFEIIAETPSNVILQSKGLVIPNYFINAVLINTGLIPTITFHSERLHLEYKIEEQGNRPVRTFTSAVEIEEYINKMSFKNRTIVGRYSDSVVSGKIVITQIYDPKVTIDKYSGNKISIAIRCGSYIDFLTTPTISHDFSLDTHEVKCIGNENILRISRYEKDTQSATATFFIDFLS